MNDNNPQKNGDADKYSEETNFNEYFSVILRHKWLIIFVTAIVLISVAYHSFTMQPIYRASTTLAFPSPEDQQSDQVFQNRRSFSSSSLELFFNREIEYLKSRNLAIHVVDSLENSPYANSLYLLGTAGKVKQNIFDKFSKIPGNINQGLAKWALKHGSSENSINNNGFFKKIRTQFADGLATVVGSPPTPQVKDTTNVKRKYKYASRLQRWASLDAMIQSGMIKISVEAPNRNEAALIANTFAAVYRKQKLSLAQGETNQFKVFLREKLNTVEQNLNYAERALQNFQQRTDAVALDQTTSNLVSRISNLQSEYDNTTTQIQSDESRMAYLNNQLSEHEKKAIDNIAAVSPPYIQSLRDTLSRAQLRLTIMQSNSDIPPNHPQLLRLKKRVNELNDELKRATEKMITQGLQSIDPISSSIDIVREILTIKGDLASLKVRETRLTNLLNKYNSELEELPSKTLQLARYQRNLQMNQDLYMLLQRRYEEAKIDAAEKAGNIQVVDAAIAPGSPVRPNLKINLLFGLVVGLGFGVGLGYLKDMLDQSVYTPEDLERIGFRVLGTVQEIDEKKVAENIRTNGDGTPSKEIRAMELRLVTHFDPKNPVSEAYRIFHTNLHFITPDTPIKSILVSSAGPGEGKSTTAANLAITSARMGNNTLLLDMDLRRPVIHKIFHVAEHPGISELLLKKNKMEDVIKSTSIEKLKIVTGGYLPPDPTELIGSKLVQQLLDQFKKQFDMVIIDSPPIVAVADSLLLSVQVSGTVLVVSSGQTNKRILRKAKQQIEDVGGEILGALLNKVKPTNLYGSSYYNYHEYLRYYSKNS